MTEEQQKFYDIKTFTDYDVAGDDVDYKVIVDHKKKEVILQFEESDSRRDWINNLLFLPWPLKLCGKYVWTTHGYARAYKSAKDAPLAEFVTKAYNYQGYKRIIRGWSFGSAMAKIAARHYQIYTGCKYIYILDELTTYGDVKCWLNPFTKYADRIKKVREYVTPNDAVTWCVPFFHRDQKNTVGPRFSISGLFHSEQYHQHYEEYDYTIWEDL